MNRDTLRKIKTATPRKITRKTSYEVRQAKLYLKRQAARKKLLKSFSSPSPFKVSYDELGLLTGATVFLDNQEIPALFNFAKRQKVIVEIGAAFGGSSSIFLSSIRKDAKLISIDPFVTDSMSTWNATEELCRQSVKNILTSISKDDRLRNWQLISKPSYEVIKGWNKKIDLIFIDGDHTYKAVKKDFEDWMPHIKKRGLILIHDSRRLPNTPASEYHRGWPGPTRLAQELTKDKRLKLAEEIHSITAWQKQ